MGKYFFKCPDCHAYVDAEGELDDGVVWVTCPLCGCVTFAPGANN